MINVNGLVVEKRIDGSVVIRKYSDPDGVRNVVSEHVLSFGEWENVVGAMENEEGLALAAKRTFKDLSPTTLAVEADRLCQAKKQREDSQAEIDAALIKAEEDRLLQQRLAIIDKMVADVDAAGGHLVRVVVDEEPSEAFAAGVKERGLALIVDAQAPPHSLLVLPAENSEAGASVDLTSTPEPVPGGSVSDVAPESAGPTAPASEVPST